MHSVFRKTSGGHIAAFSYYTKRLNCEENPFLCENSCIRLWCGSGEAESCSPSDVNDVTWLGSIFTDSNWGKLGLYFSIMIQQVHCKMVTKGLAAGLCMMAVSVFLNPQWDLCGLYVDVFIFSCGAYVTQYGSDRICSFLSSHLVTNLSPSLAPYIWFPLATYFRP